MKLVILTVALAAASATSASFAANGKTDVVIVNPLMAPNESADTYVFFDLANAAKKPPVVRPPVVLPPTLCICWGPSRDEPGAASEGAAISVVEQFREVGAPTMSYGVYESPFFNGYDDMHLGEGQLLPVR
jgi:hypothetical protein